MRTAFLTLVGTAFLISWIEQRDAIEHLQRKNKRLKEDLRAAERNLSEVNKRASRWSSSA